jgi:hypothetical protein
MTVFSDMIARALHDPVMTTPATFRNVTICGNFVDDHTVYEGVRTRDITFELVNADLDQAPAKGEKITIDAVTYVIKDTVPGQHGSTLLELEKPT